MTDAKALATPIPDQHGEAHHATLDNMERTGGGFVEALAVAWRKADPSNHRLLYRAFATYYGQYMPRPVPQAPTEAPSEAIGEATETCSGTEFEQGRDWWNGLPHDRRAELLQLAKAKLGHEPSARDVWHLFGPRSSVAAKSTAAAAALLDVAMNQVKEADDHLRDHTGHAIIRSAAANIRAIAIKLEQTRDELGRLL